VHLAFANIKFSPQNSLLQSNNVSGQSHRDIPGPEEELSIEIGLLYGVHVSDYDLAITAGQAHHGKVFQQLTANGSSTNLNTGNKSQKLTLKRVKQCFFLV